MISCNSFSVLRAQVDIEMSFTTKEHIQRLIEGLLTHSWPEDMDKIVTPFPEMKYKDAMRNYGVDKPDTRFDNLVISISFSFFPRNFYDWWSLFYSCKTLRNSPRTVKCLKYSATVSWQISLQSESFSKARR